MGPEGHREVVDALIATGMRRVDVGPIPEAAGQEQITITTTYPAVFREKSTVNELIHNLVECGLAWDPTNPETRTQPNTSPELPLLKPLEGQSLTDGNVTETFIDLHNDTSL